MSEMNQRAEQGADASPGAASAGDAPEAVAAATAMALPRQTIIFSPGTSSFDMFSGYVERGNAFRDAVLALQ